LKVLATVTPKDEIFTKRYLPQKRVKRRAAYRVMDVNEAFLEGLPLSQSKRKANHLSTVTLAKEKEKVMHLKEAKEEVEKFLLKH
jgi:hypothetical protein